jgi:hypothetical protein
VTGVQTCALPIFPSLVSSASHMTDNGSSVSMSMNDGDEMNIGEEDISMTNANSGESSMDMQGADSSTAPSDKMPSNNNNDGQDMQMDQSSTMDSDESQKMSQMKMPAHN